MSLKIVTQVSNSELLMTHYLIMNETEGPYDFD